MLQDAPSGRTRSVTMGRSSSSWSGSRPGSPASRPMLTMNSWAAMTARVDSRRPLSSVPICDGCGEVVARMEPAYDKIQVHQCFFGMSRVDDMRCTCITCLTEAGIGAPGQAALLFAVTEKVRLPSVS